MTESNSESSLLAPFIENLWRIPQDSRMQAADRGLEADAAARMALGSFLRHLGKVGSADAVHNKPGRLEPRYKGLLDATR